MRITVCVPKTIVIPDESVRALIDSARAEWELNDTESLSLEDLVSEAVKKCYIALPDGWMLHPDVRDSYLTDKECHPRRRHWGDFSID